MNFKNKIFYIKLYRKIIKHTYTIAKIRANVAKIFPIEEGFIHTKNYLSRIYEKANLCQSSFIKLLFGVYNCFLDKKIIDIFCKFISFKKTNFSNFLNKKNINFIIILFGDSSKNFLSNAICNLLAQGYKEIEIILVTKEREDARGEISFFDPKIRRNITYFQFDQKNNRLDKLLTECKGDYICFYELKDLWTKNHLKVVNQYMQQHRSCNILLNDSYICGDLNSEVCSGFEKLKHIICKTRNSIDPFSIDKLIFYFFPSSICIKKELILNIDTTNVPIEWIVNWLLRTALLENDIYFCAKKISYCNISNYSQQFPNSNIKDFFDRSNSTILRRYGLDSLISIRSNFLSKSVNNIGMQLRNSNLFDDLFYCKQEKDAVFFGEGIFEHFSQIGWKKYRDPSTTFSTKKYLLCYDDVRNSGCNPLIHYLSFGRNEGRRKFSVQDPKPIIFFFDKDSYVNQNKILLVTHILNFTGAPILLFNVAIGLKEKGFKPVILSPEEGPLMKRLEEKGIDLVIDPNVFVSQGALVYYKKYNFSLCIFNTYLNAQIFLYFNKYFPSILWIHEIVNSDSFSPEILNLLVNSNSICVPSQLTAKALAKLQVKSFFLNYPVKDRIKPGVLPRCLSNNITFGIFGTFSVRKGQDVLIDSLINLPFEILEKAKFIFCGSILDEVIYRKVISFKDILINNCIVMEQIENESAYYQLFENIDFLICPSRDDSFPLVVIDALMFGVPVLISNRVGLSDLIVSGDNGFVFPSGDINTLSNLLKFIISHRNEINYGRMSDSSRKLFLNNFDFLGSIDNIVELSKKMRL